MREQRYHISLRGSLASDYLNLLYEQADEQTIRGFFLLIMHDQCNEVITMPGNVLIIGKKHDRGKFSPDW